MAKVKFTWSDAFGIADPITGELEEICEKVSLAGSLRRFRTEVGDIEIVVEPLYDKDLYGNQLTTGVIDRYDFRKFGKVVKDGPRYKKIELPQGISLDLFIVRPPAMWPVIMAIRTGPAEFSRILVTHKNKGGMLPNNCKIEDGALLVNGRRYEVSEKAFIEFIFGKWIEPEDRDKYVEGYNNHGYW